MSLHRPWFTIVAADDKQFVVRHNCNGSTSFACTDTVNETVARLIELALEEGKRHRSRELLGLLQAGTS